MDQEFINNTSSNPHIKKNHSRLVYPDTFKLIGYPEPFKCSLDAKRYDRWFGGEIDEIRELIRGNTAVVLQGDLGVGKTEISYLIAESGACDGGKAVRIEGHNIKFSAMKISSLFQWAIKNDALVVFDSFDYLFLGSRKYRPSTTEEIFVERSRSVFQALQESIAEMTESGKGKVLLTIHEDNWLQIRSRNRGELNLLNEYREHFEHLPSHNISADFSDPESVSMYYRSRQEWEEFLPEEQRELFVDRLSQLKWNENLHELILSHIDFEKIMSRTFGRGNVPDSFRQLSVDFPDSFTEYGVIKSADPSAFTGMMIRELGRFRFHKLLWANVQLDPNLAERLVNLDEESFIGTMIEIYLDQLGSRIEKVLGVYKQSK